MSQQFPDLVIFLPGIAGSTLRRGKKLVWGPSWKLAGSAVFNNGLDRLTVANETGDEDLGDDIVPGEVVSDVQIIPGLWKIEQYGRFCTQLCEKVGLKEGDNFLRFPYDWRRDNRVSAKRLERFVAEKLAAWKMTSGNTDAKAVLVCHSMGGLVARYYIECLGGWRDVRRLFTIGTPHRGSLNALGFLANGFAKKIGPLPVDATKPLRSFDSVYQLLPLFPCVAKDGKLLRVNEYDIPNLDSARVDAALLFHQEIKQAAARNQSLDGYSSQYVSPIVSARQPTFQSAAINNDKLDLLETIDGQDHGGDGTVPAVSAVPFEMSYGQATYASGLHAALCNQEAIDDHMFAVLRTGRIDEDKFRAGTDRPQVRLRLDDVYQADRQFQIDAHVPEVHEQSLSVSTFDASGKRGPAGTLHRDGGYLTGTMKLPAGMWRIRVEGRRSLAVEDVVLSISENDLEGDRA